VLKTTPAFDVDVLHPFVTTTVRSLDAVVTSYYKTRPEDIYAGLEAADTGAKGRALEAYAIHLMRLLGLRFVEWRKRARDTGGAEIDVLLQGLFGGVPTFWQIQCKNTPRGRVDLEDVAKEVGVAMVTHATHVLLIANAPVTSAARQFATEIMRTSPLTIYLLAKEEYEAVKASPGNLGRILRAHAEQIIQARNMHRD